MVGERMKLLRMAANKTQTDVAKDLNISSQRYSYYESSSREPDHLMLKQLAEYYNVSADYLLGMTNIAKPYARLNRILLEDFAASEGILNKQHIDLLRNFTDVIRAKEKYEQMQVANSAIAARSDKQIDQPEISKEKAQAFKKYVDENEQEILDNMDDLDL